MKFSKTILSTLLLASTAPFANAYNGEVSLDYIDFDYDVTAIHVEGLYHFSEVNTANKPLAEAAFLEKRSFVNAGHTEIDYEGGSADAQNIGVGFYIPNTIFYIGAEHTRNDDFNDTEVTLGITPIDGLLISTSHNEEADDYEPNIEAKYVRNLAGDTAINLEAGFAQGADDEEDSMYAIADYYFTSFFSVGAVVADSYETEYGIRSRYFFNDSFSINGIVVSSDDADQYSIGAAFRF